MQYNRNLKRRTKSRDLFSTMHPFVEQTEVPSLVRIRLRLLVPLCKKNTHSLVNHNNRREICEEFDALLLGFFAGAAAFPLPFASAFGSFPALRLPPFGVGSSASESPASSSSSESSSSPSSENSSSDPNCATQDF